MGDAVVGIFNKDQLALMEQIVSKCRDQEERQVKKQFVNICKRL